MMSKFDYELSVYIAKDDISKRLKEIAIELSERFYNECPVIIGVLNGSFIFISDLLYASRPNAKTALGPHSTPP